MTSLPDALVALLTVGTASTLSTVPLLVSARRRATGARYRAAKAEEALERAQGELRSATAFVAALAEESRHLAEVRVPGLVRQLTHPHLAVPGLLHPRLTGTDLDTDHQQVLAEVARAVEDAQRRTDAAAAAVMRGATSSMQAFGYRLQSGLTDLQDKVDDQYLSERLFALDHLNEQSLRRIQATGVLCGAWPGLNREDSHLPDIVAAAQGRVEHSNRIMLTNRMHRPVGVVGRAVEPIAVVVAELMANAVYFSQGTLPVHVSLHHAANGVCVVVDDAGIGMHDDDIAFAEQMMHPQQEAGLSRLGDPPRAGFATIGRLAREYGFSASVRMSSQYGGVHAVLLIPEKLLVLIDEATQPMTAMAPLPARAPEPAPGPAGSRSSDPDSGAPPLPRRRRAAPAAAAPPAAAEEPRREPSIEDTADAWRAWRAGSERGREATDTEGNRR